jgi:hypothetical protein
MPRLIEKFVMLFGIDFSVLIVESDIDGRRHGERR